MIPLETTWPLADVWGSPAGFVTIFVMAIGMLGIGTKSLVLPATASYTTFVYFAVETQIGVLQPPLYGSLVLVCVGVAMKLWRAEGLDR